jgi:hypothetical protein
LPFKCWQDVEELEFSYFAKAFPRFLKCSTYTCHMIQRNKRFCQYSIYTQIILTLFSIDSIWGRGDAVMDNISLKMDKQRVLDQYGRPLLYHKKK